MERKRERFECPVCGWFSVKGRPERKLLTHMVYQHQHLPHVTLRASLDGTGWACWCGSYNSVLYRGRMSDYDSVEELLHHMRDKSGGVIPHALACILGVEFE